MQYYSGEPNRTPRKQDFPSLNNAPERDTGIKIGLLQANSLATGSGHARPCDASEMQANMRREAQAHALTDAVLNCDREDRMPFLEAILNGLRAGMPVPAFGQIMAEATFWADQASRAERKAYCAACFARLDPEDQDAFRSFIEERRAA